MSKIVATSLALLCWLAASPTNLRADLTIEKKIKLIITDSTGKASKIGRNEKVLIKDGNVKIVDETFGEILIIRTDKKVVWKIDTLDATYAEATFEEIQNRRKALFDEIREAQKRVKGIADEKEIDDLLAGMGEFNEEPQAIVRELDATKLVAGRQCKRKIVIAGGRQIIDGWYAEDIAEGADYFKALSMISAYPPSLAAKLAEIKGAPLAGDIRYSLFLNRVTSSEEAVALSVEPLKAEDFDLPQELTKVAFTELFGEPDREIKPIEIKKDFSEDELDKKGDPLRGGRGE